MTKNKIHWSNWILLPFAALYGIIISLRNFMYDNLILKSFKFDIPTISVGNISAGGAGKTPHVEYLIRYLHQYINVAVLSRGYKRNTHGYKEVTPQAKFYEVGDEPLLLKRKYRDVQVAVDESRVDGIHKILTQNPNIQTILLDDAFQHRALTPALNLLLTPYYDLFTDDFLLPVGRLREWRSGYERAHAIIVTKCPPSISPSEMDEIAKKINPTEKQHLFYSFFKYGMPYSYFDAKKRIALNDDYSALMISGIANTTSLDEYLDSKLSNWKSINYEDHHSYSIENWQTIKDIFNDMVGENKIILITEKDAVRLDEFSNYFNENNLPIYILPIEVSFFDKEGDITFDDYIKTKLLDFKS
ncbi:MAG: tetraacyldisaccharide 4'-kinase [Saprospiraceae bacterium]|nr:tetraacyldisaccharide 4'-kinase [Saprospiraceae bacterium]